MFWNRKPKKPELLSEPRPHHYVLAHHVMREVCADDPLRFFAVIASPERDQFLAWMWDLAGRHAKHRATDMSVDQIRVTTCRLGESPTIVFTLPETRAVAEAHLVGVVLDRLPAEGDVSDTIGFRYFTLEHGTNLDGSARTVLCEWADGNHRNFGNGPAADAEAFLQAIEQKLRA